METGDGIIMLATPTPAYESPKHHCENCERARRWSAVPWIIDGVLVYVDDLDVHFRRAKSAGARILSEIEDGPPGRRYWAEDVEGHRWFFFQRGRRITQFPADNEVRSSRLTTVDSDMPQVKT